MARKSHPNPHLQRLADFVRERMNLLGLSTHEVARRTGGALSHGTVWNLVNCRIQQPEVITLDLIARGIGVRKEDLLDIAHGVSKPSEKANDACLVELPKEIWLSIEAKAKMEDRTPIQQLTYELRKLFSVPSLPTQDKRHALSGGPAINEQLPLILADARKRSTSKTAKATPQPRKRLHQTA